MYEILKSLAEEQNWVFEYGRKDFQNLYNEANDPEKIYLFVDPVQIEHSYGDFNELESTTYSGRFMLMKSSELGDGYMERYLNDIKPLLANTVEIVREKLFSTEVDINTFRTIELINYLDYGFDGLIVTYNITDQTV